MLLYCICVSPEKENDEPTYSFAINDHWLCLNNWPPHREIHIFFSLRPCSNMFRGAVFQLSESSRSLTLRLDWWVRMACIYNHLRAVRTINVSTNKVSVLGAWQDCSDWGSRSYHRLSSLLNFVLFYTVNLFFSCLKQTWVRQQSVLCIKHRNHFPDTRVPFCFVLKPHPLKSIFRLHAENGQDYECCFLLFFVTL